MKKLVLLVAVICLISTVSLFAVACDDELGPSTVPEHVHVFGDWEEIKPATCTEDGISRRKCQTCNHYEDVPIPATGHHFVDGVCINPGCTATQD